MRSDLVRLGGLAVAAVLLGACDSVRDPVSPVPPPSLNVTRGNNTTDFTIPENGGVVNFCPTLLPVGQMIFWSGTGRHVTTIYTDQKGGMHWDVLVHKRGTFTTGFDNDTYHVGYTFSASLTPKDFDRGGTLTLKRAVKTRINGELTGFRATYHADLRFQLDHSGIIGGPDEVNPRFTCSITDGE